MRVTNTGENSFVVAGECPHCRSQAAFMTVTRPYQTNPENFPNYMVSAARCVACNDYILVILKAAINNLNITWEYLMHYPLGMPDETLDPNIPADVATDFKEAIRCQHVKAYRACVVMCRRALQTSALIFKASGTTLVGQIEDLGSKGIITAPLKDFAHEIRLTGNAGAHSDGLGDISARDAEAIMEFTREFFDHVYVMPAKLKARRPAPPAATTGAKKP
jgi:hypothetical protein